MILEEEHFSRNLVHELESLKREEEIIKLIGGKKEVRWNTLFYICDFVNANTKSEK